MAVVINAEISLEKANEPEKEPTFQRLRRYNLWMGFLHLAQGVAVVWLSNDFSVPVTTNFLKFNAVTQTLETMTKTVFDLRFGYWVAAFFFLSALFHFVIGTSYYKTYAKNLAQHINKARWAEYSLSASLMIVLIASLSGIYDLSTLLMMFGLTTVMNLCGLVMERQNRDNKDVDWTSFWVGSLAGILPWQPAETISEAARRLGPHRVLMASDWPFVGANLKLARERVEAAKRGELLSQEAAQLIEGRNAKGLLKL
jgi:hypothetical protein